MSQEYSFWRKIIYIVAIVVLLFPLFWIGQPATRDSAGGILARLRAENDLSQASLGDIDPASESMKLATLGLRGVAANVLWEKAHEYKKKEDWDSLSATLNQITKLQPNFITVWEHQAHNLSYNISVEFDDYRHRYHWVKKGISFLVEGIHYNRDDPRLLHYAGWITGQKIGRADEHVQFRQMFREDEEFHTEMNNEIVIEDAIGYGGRPDSWLVGRLWYRRAEQSPKPLKGKSPLIFYAGAPMSLINYASTIEEEGILGQEARRAWERAGVDWGVYGEQPIPTSWGHNIRLGDYDTVNDEIAGLREALDKLAPGVKDSIRHEKIEQLTDEERAALELPDEELTQDNYEIAFGARNKVKVSHEEVAERAPEENQERAKVVAARLRDAEMMAGRIAHYRGIINYDYWEIRCAAEQTKSAVDAREYLFKAKQHEDDSELDDARKMYEAAWVQWRKIFDEYPRLMDDVAADDLIKSIQRYERLLQVLGEELPSNFPLLDFVGMRQSEGEEIAEMYKRFSRQQPDKGTEGDGETESPGDSAGPSKEGTVEAEEPQELPKPAEDGPEKPEPPADDPPAPREQPAPSPKGPAESPDDEVTTDDAGADS